MNADITESDFGDILRKSFGVRLSGERIREALSHRSWAFEQGGIHSERLEFLGDAVLQLAVTLHLFQKFPQESEGTLTRRRAAVVSGSSLARVASQLNLGHYLLLGRGEARSGGAAKPSLLANAVESLIGAVAVDCGLEAAQNFAIKLISQPLRETEGEGGNTDPKTALHWAFNQLRLSSPEYLMEVEGPPHDRAFIATLRLDRAVVAVARPRQPQLRAFEVSARARSKKQAQILAAVAALEQLEKQGVRLQTRGGSGAPAQTSGA